MSTPHEKALKNKVAGKMHGYKTDLGHTRMHRALIRQGKRIVGDKNPPYWEKKQEK